MLLSSDHHRGLLTYDIQVLSYGDVLLRRSDVELLQGQKWLNDQVLEFPRKALPEQGALVNRLKRGQFSTLKLVSFWRRIYFNCAIIDGVDGSLTFLLNRYEAVSCDFFSLQFPLNYAADSHRCV